ncbi:MAG: HDOD domain-containing protein [Thiohalophilus sp.]|uniref:HDOD domain-containing protein n=1 Tax=Thiohalophilus sp. TaxID=3028392 RepID=UPI0028700D09|nr:HDOD domain-containing protein [Thiohalophilus sp.]MDR9435963.1 HDOD domain-containing protein [Thiohalophilus sp.]
MNDVTQQESGDYPAGISPADLVGGAVRLVSLPEVCLRVNEMVEEPDTSAGELGKVISQDASLTARLLKIVNSSFYGFPSRIETVSRAVTVIGLRELRGLVLAASAVETFSRIPTDLLNMVHFWRHSVYCAVVAQLLAEECHVLHSERLFVAGLLHDIGKLVMYNRLPEQSRAAIDLAAEKPCGDFEAEQRLLGFDHARIGAELLSVWQMPESLCAAVDYHHRPGEAPAHLIEACIVHVANSITGMAEQGLDSSSDVYVQPIDPLAWQTLSLDESIIDPLCHRAGPLFSDALEVILPRGFRSR